MTPLHIFWLVVVTLLAMVTGGVVSTLRMRNREKYRHHRSRFFRLAKEIIRLDDAPMELAMVLRSLGASMDDFTALKLVVLREVFDYTPPIRDDEGLRKLLAGADEAPEYVKTKFVLAYKEAMKAVSYRSLLFGRLVRRSLCKPPRKPDGVSQGVLLGLVRRGEKHPRGPAFDKITGLAT